MTPKPADFQTARTDRACGLALVAGGAATVAGMLYHPSVGGAGLDAIREIAEEGAVARLVHGAMLAALGVLLFGFSGLSERLGWRSPASRAAFVAYALGAVAMMGAAVVNGFAVNKVAGAFLASGSQDLDLAGSSLAVLRALSSTWAQLAVGAQAAAFGLWSAALWKRSRALAAGGLLAAAPAAASAVGILPLDVHAYLAVVATQALWTAAAGIQLLRGRLLPEAGD